MRRLANKPSPIAFSLFLAVSCSVAAAGCAVKPPKKIATGEDFNLYSKSELLGRSPAEINATESTQVGVGREMSAMPDRIKALLKRLGKKEGKASFDMSESYLTINFEKNGVWQPVSQFEIEGHYDLKPRLNDDGTATQFLVKNSTTHPKWQERTFIELKDPESPLQIKADDKILLHLLDVASLKNKEFTIKGDANDLPWLSPGDREDIKNIFTLKSGDLIKTTLTRRFFTIFKIENDGTLTLMAQGPVVYYDLVRKKNSKEELSNELEKDKLLNSWEARSKVEIDPEQIIVAKKAHDLMDLLYVKKDLLGRTFTVGKDQIPLLSENRKLLSELMEGKNPVLQGGDQLAFEFNASLLSIVRGSEIILGFTVLGHFDINPVKTAEGELTATLGRDSTSRPWNKRAYISIDVNDPLVSTDANVALRRQDLSGKCLMVESLPARALLDAVKSAGLAASDTVCLELTQTIFSIYTFRSGKQDLLMTFDVLSNFDLLPEDAQGGVPKVAAGRTWNEREYVSIVASNPQIAKNLTSPDFIEKEALKGEFIYTATVVAAHSENGLVFEGSNLEAPDRLELIVEQNTLTAYRVHEELNNSAARTPVLRYSVDQFDVERAKNGYGDRTNLLIESKEAPWEERRHIRIDFSSNQIASYFNDLLGVEKLYSGIVFTAQSKLSSGVKLEKDAITFETEEVLTPKIAAGFAGSEETRLEAVAVKIKHVFMRVGRRTYLAKSYDDHDFAKFGFFTATERGIDPALGKTDESIKSLIQRFDISGGKHIDYYLSANFPEKFRSEAHQVMASWNAALKAATGRDDVILLHDDEGMEFGDPRHSMLVYVPSRSTASPLGFGPSFVDPTTGEVLSAKAFVYGDVISQVRRSASDYYDLATGARHGGDFASLNRLPPAAALSASEMGEQTGSDAQVEVSPQSVIAPRLITRALPKTRQQALALVKQAPGSGANLLSRVLDRLRSSNSPLIAGLATGNVGDSLRKIDVALQSRNKTSTASSISTFARRPNQGCVDLPEYHIASVVKFIQAHPGKTKEQVLDEVERRIFFTTLIHEVGHNLGLRHNFQGSFDEANFPNEYHQLKALGEAGLPDPATPGEWIFKYRSSSVMDYSDDFAALYDTAGPYDVAALKFGYGDKLEVVTGKDEYGAFLTSDIPVSVYKDAVAELAASNPSASENAIHASATKALNLRPYLFCTDDHVENNPTCQRFDRGTSMTEITKSLIEDYDATYLLSGFRRGRRMFTGSSDFVIERYILPIRQLLDEYVYNLIFNSFPNPDSPFEVLPASSQDYVSAINQGVAFYERILKTAEPGIYHLDEEKGELVMGRSAEVGAKNVSLAIPDAKYLLSSEESVGTVQRVLNRGIELDKIGVLMAMSMRGFPASKYAKANLSANYFDVLHDFTLDLFSAVMREDLRQVVKLARPAGGEDFAVVAKDQDLADGTETFTAKIKASSNSLVQQYASIFAINGYDSASDRTFIDYIDFRVKGTGDALPPGLSVAEFKSASGVNTYVVPNTRDGQSISYAIAFPAAEKSKRLELLSASLAQLSDLAPLRTEIIATFAEAWRLGEGAPMGADVGAIFETNFDANLSALDTLAGMWIEAALSPEVKQQLVELRSKIIELTTRYEGYNAQKRKIEDEMESIRKDLTRAESDLLNIKALYNIFN